MSKNAFCKRCNISLPLYNKIMSCETNFGLSGLMKTAQTKDSLFERIWMSNGALNARQYGFHNPSQIYHCA